jgi:GNAT superfamily N-acetyltransferase
VDVRRAGAEDMPAVRAIADTHECLVDWPHRPDYLDFELEQEALWVAAEDEIAGFAAVVRDGELAHLADLFVRRDALGRGVGRALLGAALPRDAALLTFASGDERALPLYVRAGLRPLAPLLYLDGEPHGLEGGETERVETTTLAERDHAVSWRRRERELAFLARAGAYGLVAGERAFAVVRPVEDHATIGPAGGSRSELLALVAAAAAAHGRVQLALFGPHPALRTLLEAGLRIDDTDTFMASRPGLLDLEVYVPAQDLG